MTRTVRDNNPNEMDINQLYSLFRIHIIPERNKFHSRDFFGITREKHETAEDVWTRVLQVEKNCEFEIVTPAELIASKFLSVIGRSTGDYELKKKIRKSDMTIETKTALIHEHMYDRLNESNNSNDGKEIKHVQERPNKSGQTKPIKKNRKDDRKIKDINKEITDVDIVAHQTGQDNTYARQKWQNAEIVKEEDTMKKCADLQKEFNTWKKQHQQKMTTGITIESKE